MSRGTAIFDQVKAHPCHTILWHQALFQATLSPQGCGFLPAAISGYCSLNFVPQFPQLMVSPAFASAGILSVVAHLGHST